MCVGEPAIMAGPRASHGTSSTIWGPQARGPLWILLLCWALGVGAAPDQMPPYKAEARCSDTEYSNPDNGKCCDRCPPGKYAAHECTADVGTSCRPCPTNTFTEVWNYIPQCHICFVCDAEMGFEEDTPCSATSNTNCKCMDGMHCEAMMWNKCPHCTQHTECPPGSEVVKPGSMYADAECMPCKEGHYQSERSLEARCQRHTDCHSQGLQLVTQGSAISDSVCAALFPTETTPIGRDTSEQESNYMTIFIVLGTGIVISISLLLMVILIRTPSVCKVVGKFFHREDRRAETDRPHQTDRLLEAERVEPRNPIQDPIQDPVEVPMADPMADPTTDPMPQRRITVEGHNFEVPQVVVEPERTQRNAPSVGQGVGPYLQETGHASPCVGPLPPPTQEVLPGESNPTENPQTTKEAIATNERARISAGPNTGVQIQGTGITYNGNIYIYQVPVIPTLATGGSVYPVQVTLDPNDVPTSIPEQETPPPPMGQAPVPFCGAPGAGWHCIAPQQEEGKDMRLATEESLVESRWLVEQDSPLGVDDGSETGFGQHKRGSPNGGLY